MTTITVHWIVWVLLLVWWGLAAWRKYNEVKSRIRGKK